MTMSRRDINSLSPAELDDYIHALGILRARSAANPDDVTGYDFQAALHNDQFVGPCEHGNDLFLPWHRSHLYHFEKLLQESDPPRTANVMLPYWDWLHPQSTGKFPPAFSMPGLVEDRITAAVDLPPDTLEIVTTETDQGAFGGFPEAHPGGDFGRLESGPHNFMHFNFIGGLMKFPNTAAMDPIYYSFHCFIDLLWAEWQRRNGAPALTSPDHDLRGFLPQAKHKAADFADTVALGYDYEYTDQLKTAFAVETPQPVTRRLLATEPLALVSAPNLTASLRSNSRAEFSLAAPPAEARKVVVRLDDLKVPVAGSYVLRAYVHPADVEFRADAPDFARRYGVGYVAMWNAHRMTDGGDRAPGHHRGAEPHPHHPTECNARFDITAVLKASHAAPESLVLTLQYVPANGPDGQPEEPAGLLDEIALKDVLMEVYS
ncbi:tyrosinase family protein [Kitasatospora sp. RG8]|uniref:tyrosinase family protein n=1 Tax=Kitasatospora sp. RG8 TaxID=2820815 RepID=UPI001AE0E937|nr:tyrosinase family protein [Kitasatospora sp. RG8]MBP0451166.1 tyrosinase family protein [Kitasatospora sp. RG8]